MNSKRQKENRLIKIMYMMWRKKLRIASFISAK